MSETTFPRRLYNFFIKHWILTAFVLTIASHWFAFVQILGKNLGLVSQDGLLTKHTVIIFWPLFLVSLIFAILKTASDKYNEEVKNNGQFILERMLQSVNSVKRKKLRRFCKYIYENHGKSGLSPFNVITQPLSQIEGLLENIQVTLSEIFGINRDDIGLSIVYKTDRDEEWDWLYTMNIESDIDLSELVNNPDTTAKQLIDGKVSSLFFPDKRVGLRLNQYVEGNKDKPFNTIGSILCRDLSIDNKNKYIQAILTITTYGKQLCERNDKDSIYKIENILMPTFECRIKLELSLLYIKQVLAQKK